MEASALTTQVDANSFGYPVPPPPVSLQFFARALPATILPICAGLGQAEESVGLHTPWLGEKLWANIVRPNDVAVGHRKMEQVD